MTTSRSELKHVVNLVMGDWSADGHGHTRTVTIRSNLSRQQLEHAYEAGSKIVGFDLSEDVAADYEDYTIGEEFVLKLRAHGIDPATICDSYDEDTFSVYYDSYWLLWIGIAVLGRPDLRYEEIENEDIKIGGYGIHRG